MIVRALTIAPLRFLAYAILVTATTCLVAVLPRKYAPSILQTLSRVILFCLGLRVESEGQPVSSRIAPLVVSNHVGMFDIHILVSLETVSFLSENAIRNFAVVGSLWAATAEAIGCIFLSRKDEKSRMQSKALLSERLANIREMGGNRVLVFPEGTTSNGTSILNFKQGAFDNLCPVQPVTLDYGDKGWGYACVWSDVHFGHTPSLPSSVCKVKWLPVMTPLPTDTPQSFADRVRKAMIASSGLLEARGGSARSHCHLTDVITSHL